ncbi:hypothetical protein Tco_1451436, partial [Tanacetum coccineum]
WDLLLKDYKEAAEYIEDIKDICDDFEGLCQRNLAANTYAHWQKHELNDPYVTCDGAGGGESSKLSCSAGAGEWATKERVKMKIDLDDDFYCFVDLEDGCDDD